MNNKVQASSHGTFEGNENPTGSIESLLSKVRENLEKVEAIQRKKKILIVDDNVYIRDVLARLLEYEHFNVVIAEDGRAGLDKAAEAHPDLIIIDFNMPHLNGADTIKLLREQPDFSSVPIISITAYGQDAAQQTLEAGADRAMIKPLETDALLENIQELLADSASPRGR